MTTTVIETAIRADTQQARRETRAFTRQFQSDFQRMAGTAQTSGQQIQQAAQRLGLRSYREINQEIRRLQNSYRIAANSSQLSARQQVIAQQRLRDGVRQLRREQSGYNQIISDARSGLLGLAAVTAGVGFALSRAGRRALEFSQGMAEVSTLLPQAGNNLRELRRGVREVSVALGQDAVQSTQALYNIISSGVPEGNAIEVLEQSARAAVAGVTDTNTAARAGLAVLNAYGREVGDLESIYDVLFSTVKQGVTTLPELAQNLGQVLPIASAAEVPIEELTAAIAELTKAGVNTPQATTALRGAITALQTPTDSAAKAMRELGIEFDGLFGTLDQIANLDLTAQQIREIVPETEARTAVLALTDNLDGLRTSLEAMFDAAGATQNAYGRIEDTPQQRMARFKSTVDDLQTSLGALAVDGALPVAEAFADVLEAVENLNPSMQTLLGVLGTAAAGKLLWVAGLSSLTRAAYTAAAGVNFLSLAIKGVPLLLLGSLAVEVGTKIMNHRREVQKLADEYERFKEQAQQNIDDLEQYKDVQILTETQLQSLTDAERREYAERLRNSERYWKQQRELTSREAERASRTRLDPVLGREIIDRNEDPDTFDPIMGRSIEPREVWSPGDEELEAARQARVRDKALRELDAQLKQREALQEEHADKVRRIKADENNAIRRSLAEQVSLYKDAQKELQRVVDEREAIEQEFRELTERIRSGGDQGADTLDFIDIASIQNQAQQALNAGEFERSIQLARRAGEGLEALQQAGDSNRLALSGVAEAIRRIANDAAAAREEAQQAEVDQIQTTINELVERFKALQTIEIGFDEDNARQRADNILKAIQEQLNQSPVQIPVEITSPDAPKLSVADELLRRVEGRAGGGMLKGPGTDTSDSLLIAASNNEYVLRAAAVKRLMSQYGRGFLDQLNATGRIPGFASGGLISQIDIPSLSHEAMSAAGGSNETPINLYWPDGRSTQVKADKNAAREIREVFGKAALQAGKGN
ncbi:TP901 family phage tail tape measure protein [Methylohalomonas lacus]|uniref:TP901 family phage tail tape measure protein n=1 Tax=Methylohalomonas lacus TaxID=398773 RepID=A0AAE3L0M8_9GAMM|nr:phage tail tape measure protein [Methylohalomonas lacus]MCS3902799.1 TP901 family phage tail tape measure protein [Methylohalomonas lacus]